MSTESSNKIWGRDCTTKVEQIQTILRFPKTAAGWNHWTDQHTHRALKTLKKFGFEDHPDNGGYKHHNSGSTSYKIRVNPITFGFKSKKDVRVLEKHTETSAMYLKRLWSYVKYDPSSSTAAGRQARWLQTEECVFLLRREVNDFLTLFYANVESRANFIEESLARYENLKERERKSMFSIREEEEEDIEDVDEDNVGPDGEGRSNKRRRIGEKKEEETEFPLLQKIRTYGSDFIKSMTLEQLQDGMAEIALYKKKNFPPNGNTAA